MHRWRCPKRFRRELYRRSAARTKFPADRGTSSRAGSEFDQASFATKCIVDSQENDPFRNKSSNQKLGQNAREGFEQLSGLAEEAVISTVMALVDGPAGWNKFRDESSAMGENPTRHQLHKDPKSGCRKDTAELSEQCDERTGNIHVAASLPGEGIHSDTGFFGSRLEAA